MYSLLQNKQTTTACLSMDVLPLFLLRTTLSEVHYLITCHLLEDFNYLSSLVNYILSFVQDKFLSILI